MRSAKPEVSYIAGMLKSFRYTLTEIHLTLKEIAELFRMTKLAILPIKDVKQYAAIISKQQQYKNEISQKEKTRITHSKFDRF
jgi:hypothetical protein